MAKARIRLLKLMVEGVLAAVHQFKDEIVAYDSNLYYDVENALADIAYKLGHWGED